MERAEQLGGDHMVVIAQPSGRRSPPTPGVNATPAPMPRAAIEAAERAAHRDWRTGRSSVLGFLDVSLGNYAEALTTLQPLMARFDALPGTEIITAAFVPDAVEAMIALGRLADAEPLIEALEHNGRRLDRPWMLAIGARCRSMWLAARGDVEAADRTAQQAMAEHDRLPMPFERARTQLLLGQLQRRQRRKEAAAVTLGEALRAFEDMGTPLWAERARAELARTNVSPTQDLAADPVRTTGGRTRRLRHDQPRHRCHALHQPQDRRSTTWPGSTANSASVHAPNSGGGWINSPLGKSPIPRRREPLASGHAICRRPSVLSDRVVPADVTSRAIDDIAATLDAAAAILRAEGTSCDCSSRSRCAGPSALRRIRRLLAGDGRASLPTCRDSSSRSPPTSMPG